MKNIGMCVKMIIFLTVLVAGLGLCVGLSNARAEIEELKIGIGMDADTFNPQEQTTSVFFKMCELLYDTLFYQTPDGKLEPRLATKYELS